MMAETKTKTVYRARFNLQNAGSGSYLRLIKRLRTALCYKGKKNGHILILLPHEPIPTQFFNVEVVNEEDVATFRYRSDDLYLLGCCIGHIEKSDGEPGVDGKTWVEFKYEGGRQLIKGSTPLLFDSHYATMSNQSSGAGSFAGVTIDKGSLLGAFRRFIRTPNTETTASILLKMVLLVSESMRFHEICSHVFKNFEQTCRITADHEKLVRAWKDIAKGILGLQNSKDAPGVDCVKLNKKDLTIQEAKDQLAMMKFF